MERMVCPGEFYRHFKNKLYQIIAVAVHSETEERMVVYQALYGNYQVYVRPYDMFVSEVDHEKYPEVEQKYRFERVIPEDEEKKSETISKTMTEIVRQEPNPYLLEFLDADGFEKRMECLKHLADTASQSDLDSIYLVLDMKPQEGTVREQVENIRRYLSMQYHFDGSRLR
ncbi:MAG: DUF1653 domain-containing protein [Brotaphodocola sp.]